MLMSQSEIGCFSMLHFNKEKNNANGNNNTHYIGHLGIVINRNAETNPIARVNPISKACLISQLNYVIIFRNRGNITVVLQALTCGRNAVV